MPSRMDEGDELEIDPIFQDDQCILCKPICMAAARRHPGFSGSEISVGSTEKAPEAAEDNGVDVPACIMREHSIGSAWVSWS